MTIAPVELDVQVTPPYLARSYACYLTLCRDEPEVAVFPDRGGDAYCAARARETGAALSATRIVVDCAGPTLRAVELERRTYISKNVLGTAVAERLALELADGYVCADPEVEEWLQTSGWRLPPKLETPLEGNGARREVATPTDRPLVSIVIAYHERTQFLPFCLDGLAHQTYAPLEVVIADDGSTSEAARAQLAELEGRSWPWQLRVVRLSRGGTEHARNGGWRAASGQLITFIDDDDVPFPDMVESLWRARIHSGAELAVGGGRFFRGDGAPSPSPGDVVRIPLCDPHELGLISNQYGGPVVLWPRGLLETIGGFTESLVEDWVLLARANLHGARATTPPDPVFWYRQTGTGRHSRDPVVVRDAGVPQLAEVFAGRLPEDLRLLPHLAAGAYAELERRAHAADRPRSARNALRSVVRRIARR